MTSFRTFNKGVSRSSRLLKIWVLVTSVLTMAVERVLSDTLVGMSDGARYCLVAVTLVTLASLPGRLAMEMTPAGAADRQVGVNQLGTAMLIAGIYAACRCSSKGARDACCVHESAAIMMCSLHDVEFGLGWEALCRLAPVQGLCSERACREAQASLVRAHPEQAQTGCLGVLGLRERLPQVWCCCRLQLSLLPLPLPLAPGLQPFGCLSCCWAAEPAPDLPDPLLLQQRDWGLWPCCPRPLLPPPALAQGRRWRCDCRCWELELAPAPAGWVQAQGPPGQQAAALARGCCLMMWELGLARLGAGLVFWAQVRVHWQGRGPSLQLGLAPSVDGTAVAITVPQCVYILAPVLPGIRVCASAGMHGQEGPQAGHLPGWHHREVQGAHLQSMNCMPEQGCWSTDVQDRAQTGQARTACTCQDSSRRDGCARACSQAGGPHCNTGAWCSAQAGDGQDGGAGSS